MLFDQVTKYFETIWISFILYVELHRKYFQMNDKPSKIILYG